MSEDLKLFEQLGLELPAKPNSSGQFVLDCPFSDCGKESHFFLSAKTGQWSCKVCSRKGNKYSFLKQLYEDCLSTTKVGTYKRLSLKRKKFPPQAFIDSRIAHHKGLNAWLYPTWDTKGSVLNIGIYNGDGAVLGLAGLKQHLFGLETLEAKGPIYICEGQHDAVSLRYLLSRFDSHDGPYTVLAVPGSSSLPKPDLEHLRNRDVYLLYDNDDSGRNGAKVHGSTLHKIAKSVHVLAWPENRFPDKFDVDDYIREGKERPEQLWSDLLSWCFRYGPGADPTAPAPHVIRTSINAILKDFKETDIHVFPSMKDSLILTCAIAHSINIPGEPLWMYLIGQPGAGKSLILESTLGSKNCLYRTSVTHKSFLSGFKGDGGPDTSLLAIIPGKCLIVKDYSNVLSLPAAEQDQLVSLLREAYDGRIVRSYGNQVYREYPPADSPFKDCRFSFVAGVTREIHARSHAGLGERFLKFEMDPTDGDNLRAIQAAVDDSWKSHDHSLQRMAGVGSFLDRELDWSTLPNIPKWYRNRIIALAQWVGLCRTPVARTQGDLDYDPSPESGTRVVKQFLKLSQAVAMTLNLKSAESETYRLVRKVAWDTAHGWRRNLFQIFAQDQFLSATDIVNALDYSHSTVHRVIKDMVALSILKRTKSTPNPTGHGKPLQNWRLTDKAKVMWQTAKLGDL